MACLGSAYFIYQNSKEERKENQAREERLNAQIDKFTLILTNFNVTLNTINDRLTFIEEKIGSGKE